MLAGTQVQAGGEVVGISRGKGCDGDQGRLAGARNGMALGALERQEAALLKSIKAAEKALKHNRMVQQSLRGTMQLG